MMLHMQAGDFTERSLDQYKPFCMIEIVQRESKNVAFALSIAYSFEHHNTVTLNSCHVIREYQNLQCWKLAYNNHSYVFSKSSGFKSI
jgi:hypothetical protein